MLSTLFHDLLNAWATYLFFFMAGVADGIRDGLMFRYDTMGWKPAKFWDPDISWRNKYKNWPADQRPRFPLATTALVWLTDGWHLFKFLNTVFIVLALVAAFFVPAAQSPGWLIVLALMPTLVASYKAGFAVYYLW